MPKLKKGSLREYNSGFTLIEVAIILVLIGLLIGLGASLIGPLTKRVKVQDTRERIDAAVESVLGFAVATKRLPNESDFNSTVRNPVDAWGKPLRYVVWGNFTLNEPNVICPSNATSHGFNITVETANGNRTISNVAFLIISSGPNYNLQTKFNGTNNVWYIYDNNENITVYLPGANKDDFSADGNFTDYDDIVKWVTVYELMQKACHGEQSGDEGPLRIITYFLPIGKQNEPYSAEIIAVGGVKPYTWPGYPSSLNGLSINNSTYYSLQINGTPQCPGTYNLPVIVKDSKGNTASRTFTLSIQPDLITFTPVSGTTWYAPNGTSFPTTNIYVTGGMPSYNSTCNPDNNCPTLTCSANNNTISISGTTPTNPTTCYFNVTTTDSCNTNASASYAIVIRASSDGGGSGGGGGGGGGGGTNPPTCSLSYNPQPVLYNNAAIVNYSITNGPASGNFSPQTGTCTSFSNSIGGNCTTSQLTSNLNLTLTVYNTYGSNTCSVKICAQSQANAQYDVWNTAGATYRFRLPNGQCVLRNNNARITTNAVRLGYGQQITRHQSTDTNCQTPIATLNYLEAVCADDDADRQVNWGASGATDR